MPLDNLVPILHHALALLGVLYFCAQTFCDDADFFLMMVLAFVFPRLSSFLFPHGCSRLFAARVAGFFFLFYFVHRLILDSGANPLLLLLSVLRAFLAACFVCGVLHLACGVLAFFIQPAWHEGLRLRRSVTRFPAYVLAGCRRVFAWFVPAAPRESAPISTRRERIRDRVNEAVADFTDERQVVDSLQLAPFEQQAILQEQRQRLMQKLKDILQ